VVEVYDLFEDLNHEVEQDDVVEVAFAAFAFFAY